MLATPFIALTDKAWFDYLSRISQRGRVDEVNFWSPRARRPMKVMRPGEPVFFRLKSPINAIAGYGFFAHFALLSLDIAWDTFGAKNGDPDKLRFLTRIGFYRDIDLLHPDNPRDDIGCTMLRDAAFWPQQRWIAWGAAEGWHANIVQGKTESDANRASRLLAEIAHDQVGEPEEFAPEFEPLEVDARELALAENRAREGQGAFRSRLLDVYGRRCAVTGEKTEPVLDAAHVQPYLGPRSNHIQNGMILSKEFHALFDRGLVTITPEYRVRVSPKIREREVWSRGVETRSGGASPRSFVEDSIDVDVPGCDRGQQAG